MRIDLLTLFPGTFDGFLKASLIGKALNNKTIEIYRHNIRDFASGKHRQADDRPYGGGPGMVLMAEPIYKALEHVKKKFPVKKANRTTLLLSPRGRPLTARLSAQLAGYKHLILLCGHYEGIDERIAAHFDHEVSIGNYVLMSGETAAMVVIEAVARHIKGVVKEKQSIKEDSFSISHQGRQLLEWPQYTRPRLWRRRSVPAILLSGDHKKIKSWRLTQAFAGTMKRQNP